MIASELERVKRLLHEKEKEATEALKRQQREQRETGLHAGHSTPPRQQQPMEESVFGGENSLFGLEENHRQPADIPPAATNRRGGGKEQRPLQGFFEVCFQSVGVTLRLSVSGIDI